MRVFNIVWRTLLFLVIVAVVLSGGIIIFLTITDYQPKPMEELPVMGTSLIKGDPKNDFTFLTWNIGYAGLGRETDFFYDGGKMVRPSLQQYQVYLNGIYNILSHADTLDYLLLQEVDKDAKRSYFINQVELIANNLHDFTYSFARNYDVKFIPFPFFAPMAKVTAGLMSINRFKPSESMRISAPVNFSWPKRIFFLDRCLLVMRFPLVGGKTLIVINLHQSAWAEGANLRKYEMKLLKETVQKEYEHGNYVVAGGDWNQSPPGYISVPFKTGDKIRYYENIAEKESLPKGWKYVYDLSVPTNRDVDAPYKKGTTRTSIIDYYLVSPNIEVKDIRVLNNGFAFSDHHPVYLRVKLLSDSIMATRSIPQSR